MNSQFSVQSAEFEILALLPFAASINIGETYWERSFRDEQSKGSFFYRSFIWLTGIGSKFVVVNQYSFRKFRKELTWPGSTLNSEKLFGYSRAFWLLNISFLIPDKSHLVYSCSGYSPHGQSFDCDGMRCNCKVGDRSSLSPVCQATVISFSSLALDHKVSYFLYLFNVCLILCRFFVSK